MSKPAMKSYPAAFKERAVKLAVESDQPIAQTARDLGVKPRRATAFGPARHWPFAGGASHPTLDPRGSLSPLETPGVGGTRPPKNPHSHSSPPQAVGHPGPFS